MTRQPLPLPPRSDCRYQPFYCEENVWHLCADPRVPGTKHVVVISNVDRACPLWAQRAAAAGRPVVWDYHVVLTTVVPAQQPEPEGAATTWVLDLDSTLPWPCALDDYLRATFAGIEQLPAEAQPRFRVFTGHAFVGHFGSDRSHMRGADGAWRAPPPPWPAPRGREPRLALVPSALDMRDGSRATPGILVDLEGLRALLTDAGRGR